MHRLTPDGCMPLARLAGCWRTATTTHARSALRSPPAQGWSLINRGAGPAGRHMHDSSSLLSSVASMHACRHPETSQLRHSPSLLGIHGLGRLEGGGQAARMLGGATATAHESANQVQLTAATGRSARHGGDSPSFYVCLPAAAAGTWVDVGAAAGLTAGLCCLGPYAKLII
jgi:hypothetical protein